LLIDASCRPQDAGRSILRVAHVPGLENLGYGYIDGIETVRRKSS
jgi:hypothetical protein